MSHDLGQPECNFAKKLKMDQIWLTSPSTLKPGWNLFRRWSNAIDK